ncbi:MAG: hypothetical protein DWQ19_09440 [Crenarchaeota archaeon]|nr:MAG: hypothetical protein DWQ19_09440 [Thermoproteota archaeon]
MISRRQLVKYGVAFTAAPLWKPNVWDQGVVVQALDDINFPYELNDEWENDVKRNHKDFKITTQQTKHFYLKNNLYHASRTDILILFPFKFQEKILDFYKKWDLVTHSPMVLFEAQEILGIYRKWQPIKNLKLNTFFHIEKEVTNPANQIFVCKEKVLTIRK